MTVHHLEAFSFKLFSRDDTTEFLEYLKAKYYIFVKEENWSLPFNDETAAEDDYDTKGLFISCNKNEESAAIARGLISLDNIPYPELYKHHLHHIATHLWPNIASINTVGVKNKFRGLMPLHARSKKSSSLAHYMVQRLTTELVARGALVVIVSVASRNSYKLFARLGFVPIDKPVLLNKYDKQILNMGLVLGAGHKSEFTEQFLFQPPVYIHENQKTEKALVQVDQYFSDLATQISVAEDFHAGIFR